MKTQCWRTIAGLISIWILCVTPAFSQSDLEIFQSMSPEEQLRVLAIAQIRANQEKARMEHERQQAIQTAAQAQWNKSWQDAADHADEANQKAIKYNIELALKGDDYGQYRMGQRCRDGEGVPKNLTQAREWFSKAAAQGLKPAAHELNELTNSFAEFFATNVVALQTNKIANLPPMRATSIVTNK